MDYRDYKERSELEGGDMSASPSDMIRAKANRLEKDGNYEKAETYRRIAGECDGKQWVGIPRELFRQEQIANAILGKKQITILWVKTTDGQEWALILRHCFSPSGRENLANAIVKEYDGEKWVLSEWVYSAKIDKQARQLAEKNSEIADLKAENAELKPKAEFTNIAMQSKDVLSMNYAAKVLKLGYGDKTLYKKLREMGILMENNVPYQKYIQQGYFIVDERPICIGADIRIELTTRVTQNGMVWLAYNKNFLL
jgi:phage antirepressor YoqD-like protein